MPRTAVICEFNPFHNGHKFLLEKIKSEYSGEIVCIMSGNFVQRGDIAITDKYNRTETALQNGADLVAELPTVYAVSSAQSFAENGVRLAAALHCDRLCFGAENSLSELKSALKALESDAVQHKIAARMKEGCYYPRALSEAVGETYAAVIAKPNNILALEYIKACKQYNILPVAVPRKGAAHDDSAIVDNIASASKIRELIENGEAYKLLTPMKIDAPCSLKSLEPAILYRLKTVTPDELRCGADVAEGLEYRIIEAAKQYHSLSEICDAVKTKRYTMARIRRIIIAAFLNITAEMQRTPVPYARILGIRSGAESLLQGAELPLIVKIKADYDRLNHSAKEIFNVDLRAAEAMNIAKGGQPINEFTQQVIKR